MKIKEKKPVKGRKSRLKSILIVIISLILALAVYYFYTSIIISVSVFLSILILSFIYSFFSKSLQESKKIAKMEAAFPDFLQLMSSNLRAGMTISKALLLSSREEFAPLDKEIFRVGKDITTGKDTEIALLDMSNRIKSEKIHKTILLIISGIKAGGNLAILLEETASNIRERGFIEKRAASNVMMYVIFIFVAVAVAAPALFALSNILVEVMTNLLKGLPPTETSMSLPFTMSSISISPVFVTYFSIIFMLMLDVLASLVLGLVSKGEEKQGIKYILPILVLSLGIFFILKFFLSRFLTGLF